MIRLPYITLGLAAVISACDSPPADNSPVAPEAVCTDPQHLDSDSAVECVVPDSDLPAEDINEIKENTNEDS